MGIGKLEMFVGGMYAEKSTNLIREGKRHMLAGRKVLFVKPSIDGRYSDDEVVTHDGVKHKAINIDVDLGDIVEFEKEFNESDVVCIDEIQFFNKGMIDFIDTLIREGKLVYVAGLDLDRFGKPFGITPYLMALAEKVTKVHAVCTYCGNDAWVTIGTDKLNNNNQVNVGNEYIPVCRQCSIEKGGL